MNSKIFLIVCIALFAVTTYASYRNASETCVPISLTGPCYRAAEDRCPGFDGTNGLCEVTAKCQPLCATSCMTCMTCAVNTGCCDIKTNYQNVNYMCMMDCQHGLWPNCTALVTKK